MYIRLLFLNFLPEHTGQVRKLYNEEIIPSMKGVKGLVTARLLEPTSKRDNHIALSEWESLSDAQAYERSALHKEQHRKILAFTTKKPLLKTYTSVYVTRETPLWIGEDSEA